MFKGVQQKNGAKVNVNILIWLAFQLPFSNVSEFKSDSETKTAATNLWTLVVKLQISFVSNE